MLTIRLALAAISIILIWGLFSLPKSVVQKEGGLDGPSQNSPKSENSSHQIDGKFLEKISRLRENFFHEEEKEKSAIFADSLAILYQKTQNLDSATWFAEVFASLKNDRAGWEKAGDLFFEAFSFSLDPKKQQTYAEKSREYFNKVLEGSPNNLDVKSKVAMTYIGSPNTMQGIQMLKEVLEENPNHEQALFNLGMLSVQSGQYELAKGRLEHLLDIHPEHLQGNLLLGITLMNLGNKEDAKRIFEKVKTLDNDPAVIGAVDSYLEELK